MNRIAIVMAFRSTLRNWRQTLATLNAVAIGFVAFALIQGYLLDAETQFADFYVHRSMYGHLIVEKDAESKASDPWFSQMDESEAAIAVEEIQALGADVKAYVSFMPIQGIVAGKGSNLNFFGFAYDVASGESMRGERWDWNTVSGQPLRGADTSKILVGRGLAELLGCDLGQVKPETLPDGRYKPVAKDLDCFNDRLQLTSLTEKGKINALDMTISGIVDAGMRSMEDSWLMMPMSQARILFHTQRVARIGIGLKDESKRDELLAKLKQRFEARSVKLRAMKWEDHPVADFYRGNIAIMRAFQNFILFIVAVVCSMTLSSTIRRNIMQRTRDIGCLRSLGFKRRFIIMLFAWEGFFLGLLGSLVGAAVAFALSQAINALGFTYIPGLISQPVPLRIETSISAYALSIVLLSLLSWAIASIAVVTRSKKNIAESLSHS